MKNSTKRILMSVLTLVLTVVALGTTTFAWFSIGNISTVTGISGEVQAGDGLEVRLHNNLGETAYDSGFLQHLTPAEFNAYLNSIGGYNGTTNLFQFAAVTSDNGTSFNELFVRSDGDLQLRELTEALGANKKFLEFKLDFRSLQPGTISLTTLAFTGSGVEFDPTGSPAYLQTDSSTPTTNKVSAFAANAARVSFTHGATPTTVIFENTATPYLTTDGVISGNHAGQNSAVAHGQWSFLDSRNVTIYNSSGTALNIVEPTSGTTIQKAEDLALSAEKLVLTLGEFINGYHSASVTVRVWIEGWDADTYDAIFKAPLSVNMTFTKTTNPTP